jgi:hypothetical protein
VASKHGLGGETDFVCQKKKQPKERVKTSLKANRLLLKRANSCARKWNTFGKANTALARLNRRLPSGYRKREEPE